MSESREDCCDDWPHPCTYHEGYEDALGETWWLLLDRNDWPKVRSVDFGGDEMVDICPGCCLYRGNDEDPSDHFVPNEPPCEWAIARLTEHDA